MTPEQDARARETAEDCRQLPLWAARQIVRLTDRVQQLEKQLPEGMKHCTIVFVECPQGHGRLTATNWVLRACQTCRIAYLELALNQIKNGCVDEDDVANELFRSSPDEIRKLCLKALEGKERL